MENLANKLRGHSGSDDATVTARRFCKAFPHTFYHSSLEEVRQLLTSPPKVDTVIHFSERDDHDYGLGGPAQNAFVLVYEAEKKEWMVVRSHRHEFPITVAKPVLTELQAAISDLVDEDGTEIVGRSYLPFLKALKIVEQKAESVLCGMTIRGMTIRVAQARQGLYARAVSRLCCDANTKSTETALQTLVALGVGVALAAAYIVINRRQR